MAVKLELYRVFQEVAKMGNISAAAQNLYISQSAVSQSIKQLEEQLQVRLFSRSTRGVMLTSEGRTLLEYVTRALGLIQNGEEKLAQSRQLLTGELIIGASDTVTKTYLVSRLEAFHKAYPDIRIRILNGTSRMVLDYLRGGQVDIAFASEEQDAEVYCVRHCVDTHTIFVAAPDYDCDFDHPYTVQEIAEFPLILLERKASSPIFVGASDGGMVAQIYVQRYPGETGGLVLISTGGMDENTLKSLKRKYRLAPLMLWYMKHCNYEKLKPTLIKAGMSHIRNESADEIAYAQDMFETIFKDYKQEKDVHISGLLADLMHQKPVTAADFAVLAGKILLILPDQDFFSGKMQEDLIRLMHGPKISYVSGGHLSTVLRVDDYVRTILDFLKTMQ